MFWLGLGGFWRRPDGFEKVWVLFDEVLAFVVACLARKNLRVFVFSHALRAKSQILSDFGESKSFKNFSKLF